MARDRDRDRVRDAPNGGIGIGIVFGIAAPVSIFSTYDTNGKEHT